MYNRNSFQPLGRPIVLSLSLPICPCSITWNIYGQEMGPNQFHYKTWIVFPTMLSVVKNKHLYLTFLAGFRLVKKTSVFMNYIIITRVIATFQSFWHSKLLLYLGMPLTNEAEPASMRRSCKYHTLNLLGFLATRTRMYELDCTNQIPPNQTLHKEMKKWHEKQGLCGINLNYGWWQEINSIQSQEVTILEATSIM